MMWPTAHSQRAVFVGGKSWPATVGLTSGEFNSADTLVLEIHGGGGGLEVHFHLGVVTLPARHFATRGYCLNQAQSGH